MQIHEESDLLNALVNLNDRSPFQCEPSEEVPQIGQRRYETLELIDYLSEIKLGVEYIKLVAKGRVDNKILDKFERIDNAISKMNEKLLESRPPNYIKNI